MAQLIPLSSTFFINVSDSLRFYYQANVEQQGWPTFFRVNIDNVLECMVQSVTVTKLSRFLNFFWSNLSTFVMEKKSCASVTQEMRTDDARNAYDAQRVVISPREEWRENSDVNVSYCNSSAAVFAGSENVFQSKTSLH